MNLSFGNGCAQNNYTDLHRGVIYGAEIGRTLSAPQPEPGRKAHSCAGPGSLVQWNVDKVSSTVRKDCHHVSQVFFSYVVPMKNKQILMLCEYFSNHQHLLDISLSFSHFFFEVFFQIFSLEYFNCFSPLKNYAML